MRGGKSPGLENEAWLKVRITMVLVEMQEQRREVVATEVDDEEENRDRGLYRKKGHTVAP
jgi:hypothetical protein